MSYLVDSNVWLERLLGQTRASDVASFLSTVPTSRLVLTDFALHSIAMILARRKADAALTAFMLDLSGPTPVRIARTPPSRLPDILYAMHQLKLDYDDACQYSAAERLDLTLVSFDADFDSTPRGRQTPAQVVNSYKA